MKDFMKEAVERALKTSSQNEGGPFGAVIVKDNEIIAIASNSVLKDNDPTAHAEINAIRQACKKLNTYDLTGCILYTTCEPCPMCLSAIIWSNIKKVYYGCTADDANSIGFRDDYIYNFIKTNCQNIDVLELNQMQRDECLKLFKAYEGKTIY
ncbi:MAG: nucleoside deaminase [Christensenellales bacterium]